MSDVHGAVEDLAREAADADALLVCGDLVNFLDYRTMEGPVVDVFGLDAARAFVALRVRGRPHQEAADALRAVAGAHADEGWARVRAAIREQYERLFDAFPDNTYLTHGNVDRPSLFADLLRPGVRHLDGEVAEVGGLRVGFVGGGLPREEGTPAAAAAHAGFAARVAALGPVDVLCSHMPPAHGDLPVDEVTGLPEPSSPALVEHVVRHQPTHLYFGHVHQPRAATATLGRTRMVNVGYFRATGRMPVHPAG